MAVLVTIAIVASGAGWSALLVWAWVYFSRTPWAEIGYVRLTHAWRTVLGGIAIGVVLKLVMKAIVMPMLHAPPINAHYAFLAGDYSALPGMLLLVVFRAGLGEETVWRGFLFQRFARLLGTGRVARGTTLVVTSALFALAHLSEQGVPGAQQAFAAGMVFGGLYLATRSLWLPVLAHAAFDVVAVLIISLRLEERVAHWLFR